MVCFFTNLISYDKIFQSGDMVLMDIPYAFIKFVEPGINNLTKLDSGNLVVVQTQKNGIPGEQDFAGSGVMAAVASVVEFLVVPLKLGKF